jgi:AraC-like DNA-binding protein
MLRSKAEKAARQMIMSEYRHHSYEEELRSTSMLLRMERDEFIRLINGVESEAVFLRYVDVLGPTRVRALKNSLICYILPLCRIAISMGVDSELSFALSDFYINHLEGINEESELLALFRPITLHYYDLVQQQETRGYSKAVASAVRYIGRNLFGRIKVSEVADYVRLERHYFAGVFSKQVGLSPSKYILLRKLDEGRRLITHTSITVSEVAESLGFYDTAHFSRSFRLCFGVSPSEIRTRDFTDLG